MVIVANRAESYVMFNYGDIAWTTGKASKGDENGLDGYPAEVGNTLIYSWKIQEPNTCEVKVKKKHL